MPYLKVISQKKCFRALSRGKNTAIKICARQNKLFCCQLFSILSRQDSSIGSVSAWGAGGPGLKSRPQQILITLKELS